MKYVKKSLSLVNLIIGRMQLKLIKLNKKIKKLKIKKVLWVNSVN